ncbi:hypothetical protein NEF87_001000 [Candidatus Lokiarchaeum ossiferum]|uniref:Ig-like domain-containing protein n=1 Tax=Candidatus Lokiarchaeum ossiferum TaxID=2951803 RepID=A0ABY6HMH1_9ARCH|nr:hypothetical protein NEF87_001000 [Candidatus Lokiarchaeum sp. B-35]
MESELVEKDQFKNGNERPTTGNEVLIKDPMEIDPTIYDQDPIETWIYIEGELGNNDWYISEVTIQLECSRLEADVFFSVDNQGWEYYDGMPIIIEEDGEHIFSYYSEDMSTGEIETTNEEIIKIATSIPVTSFEIMGELNTDATAYVSEVFLTLEVLEFFTTEFDIFYIINSGDPQLYQGSIILDEIGIYFIEYYVSIEAREYDAEFIPEFEITIEEYKIFCDLIGTIGDDNWYISDIEITIDNFQMEPIYYSLNGDPEQEYTSPMIISEDGMYDLYFYSSINGQLVEGSQIFSIDQTSPTTDIEIMGIMGQNEWYLSEVEISFDSIDLSSGVKETYYSYDQMNWNVYSTIISTTIEGSNTIYFYSTDNAGNVGETLSQIFYIETSEIEVNVEFDGLMGDNSWFKSDVEISITTNQIASEIAAFTYSTNGIEFIPYTGTFYYTEEGVNFIYFNISSNAGHNSFGYREISIDKTNPLTTLNISGIMGENDWYIANIDLDFISTDLESTVASIYYSFDNITWSIFDGTPISIDIDGIYSLFYYSKDLAGNIEQYKSEIIKIDTKAPEIYIEYSGTMGANGWYTSDVDILISLNNSTSGIYEISCTLNGNIISPFINMIEVTSEGENILNIEVTSFSGAKITYHDIIKIDKTSPTTEIYFDGDVGSNGWYLSEGNVSLTASDNLLNQFQIWYKIDANDWMIYEFPLEFLSDGIYNISFYSTDFAGNKESVKEFKLALELTKPEVLINISGIEGNNGWYNSIVQVIPFVTNSISGHTQFTYSINNESFLPYFVPLNISEEGYNDIKFELLSIAGNIVFQNISLLIDYSNPTILCNISGVLDEFDQYKSPVTVNLTGIDKYSGINNISYSLDGNIWKLYTSPLEFSEDDFYMLYFVALDNAGNFGTINTCSFIINKTIDEQPLRHCYGWTFMFKEHHWWFGLGELCIYETRIDLTCDSQIFSWEIYEFSVNGRTEIYFAMEKQEKLAIIIHSGKWNTICMGLGCNVFFLCID